MTPLIAVEKLSVTRSQSFLLKEIELSIQPGELIWLIGPNGSGKTTLFRAMLGIMRADSGTIRLSGRDIAGISRRDAARRLGYVPQSAGGLIPFTCFQFVLMARYPRFSRVSGPTRADEHAARRALEETETLDLAERRIDTLSGGERQRVFIAAALAQETDALLLDEPTACLDPRHHVEVLSFLASLNRRVGRTLVCATHDLNCLSLYGGRAVALNKGSIVFDGPAENALSPDILQDIYGLSFKTAPWPGRPGVRIAVPEAAR